MFRRRKRNKLIEETSLLLHDDSANIGMESWKTPNKLHDRRRQPNHKSITIERIESIPSGLTEQTTQSSDETWFNDTKDDNLTPIQRHRSNQSSVRTGSDDHVFAGSLSCTSSETFRKQSSMDDGKINRTKSKSSCQSTRSYRSHQQSESSENISLNRRGPQQKKSQRLPVTKSASTLTKSLVDNSDESSTDEDESDTFHQQNILDIPNYMSRKYQESYKHQVRRMEDDDTVTSRVQKVKLSLQDKTTGNVRLENPLNQSYLKPRSISSLEVSKSEDRVTSMIATTEWTPLPSNAVKIHHQNDPIRTNESPEVNVTFCDIKSPLEVMKEVKTSLMSCISPVFLSYHSSPSPLKKENMYCSDDEFEYLRRQRKGNIFSPMRKKVDDMCFRSMHGSPMRDKSLLDDEETYFTNQS